MMLNGIIAGAATTSLGGTTILGSQSDELLPLLQAANKTTDTITTCFITKIFNVEAK